MPSSGQVSIPARRSAPSTWSVRRRLSIAASRWVAHRVRPRAPGGQRAQLLAAVFDHRAVGDRDPPAGQHRRLLGAGGGDHRLPVAASSRSRARASSGLPSARSWAAGDPGRLAVGGERVVDRDRVGLGEDHQALAVGDDPAQLRERVLDPRQLATGRR